MNFWQLNFNLLHIAINVSSFPVFGYVGMYSTHYTHTQTTSHFWNWSWLFHTVLFSLVRIYICIGFWKAICIQQYYSISSLVGILFLIHCVALNENRVLKVVNKWIHLLCPDVLYSCNVSTKNCKPDSFLVQCKWDFACPTMCRFVIRD